MKGPKAVKRMEFELSRRLGCGYAEERNPTRRIWEKPTLRVASTYTTEDCGDRAKKSTGEFAELAAALEWASVGLVTKPSTNGMFCRCSSQREIMGEGKPGISGRTIRNCRSCSIRSGPRLLFFQRNTYMTDLIPEFFNIDRPGSISTKAFVKWHSHLGHIVFWVSCEKMAMHSEQRTRAGQHVNFFPEDGKNIYS